MMLGYPVRPEGSFRAVPVRWHVRCSGVRYAWAPGFSGIAVAVFGRGVGPLLDADGGRAADP
jgi:hypothetical protein